jgi:hypothetical protein
LVEWPEAASLSLGTVAVRTAAKLWLGDRKIAAEVTASAVDVLSGLITQCDSRVDFVHRTFQEYLASYATDKRVGVQREPTGNWSKFDVEDYARIILSKIPFVSIVARSPDEIRTLKYVHGARRVEIA